jgi:hypothetical protein
MSTMHSSQPHMLKKFRIIQYSRNSSSFKHKNLFTYHYISSTHYFFVHSYNGCILFRREYYNLAHVCTVNYRYASQRSLLLTFKFSPHQQQFCYLGLNEAHKSVMCLYKLSLLHAELPFIIAEKSSSFLY